MSSRNAKCIPWANYPYSTKGATGGFAGFNSLIIVCGGEKPDISDVCGGDIPDMSDKCNIVTPKKTEILTTMQSARYDASSLILKEKILWVCGGNNGINILSSSEYIEIESTAGPEMPEALEGHKMIAITDDLILFTGGSLSSTSQG